MAKIWTKEEEEQLRLIYNELGARECSKVLNKSIDAIKQKASRLGLKSPRSKAWTTEDYDNELLNKELDVLRLEPYAGSQTPILHECYLGHEWKARPAHIIQGKGCPTCAAFQFNKSLPAILYYIKIAKDNLSYYKIGVSNKDLAVRFALDSDKCITPLLVESFTKGQDAYDKEQTILKEFATYRVTVPGFLKSKGNTELFEIDILEVDK